MTDIDYYCYEIPSNLVSFIVIFISLLWQVGLLIFLMEIFYKSLRKFYIIKSIEKSNWILSKEKNL